MFNVKEPNLINNKRWLNYVDYVEPLYLEPASPEKRFNVVNVTEQF